MKLKALLAFALLLLLKLKNVANGESVDKIPSSIEAESGIKLRWCLEQIKFALELENRIGKIIKKYRTCAIITRYWMITTPSLVQAKNQFLNHILVVNSVLKDFTKFLNGTLE